MTTAYLWTRHRPLARRLARDWQIPGWEAQDVEQEAEIALWHACRDYRPDRGTKFTTFARMVISRRLSVCLRLASNGRHRPLNESQRVVLDPDGELEEIVALLPCIHQVTDLCEDRERLRNVIRAIHRDLTDFERYAIVGIAMGISYTKLGDPKQVGNAAYKARLKLRALA